jgi:hypothetical protein
LIHTNQKGLFACVTGQDRGFAQGNRRLVSVTLSMIDWVIWLKDTLPISKEIYENG